MPQLGKTSTGTDTDWGEPPATIDIVGPFTSNAVGGILGSGWMRIQKPVATAAVRLVLYADNGSGTDPGASIAATDEVTVTTALADPSVVQFSGWTKQPGGVAPTLAPSTRYWIGIWYGTSGSLQPYDLYGIFDGSAPATSRMILNTAAAYSSTAAKPTVTPSGSFTNYAFDLWFDYGSTVTTVTGAAALTGSGSLSATGQTRTAGISIVGSAGANSTSVAIPSFLVGDLIIVTARGTSSAPSIPTASGTVPAWTSMQSGIADSVGLTTGFFIATATTHTTGVWTGAQHICVIVLRAGIGKTISTSAARSAAANVASTNTMAYPALSGITNGSTGVRIGARLVAGSAVANPPTSWTTRIAQPSPSTALVVHTRSALAADISADTVTGMSSSTASRCHTIEVLEIGGAATVSGAAALTAAGALTSTAIRTRSGASALSALGVLSATGTRKRLAATVLGGAGTLSATAVHTVLGEAQLVGGGSLTIPLASRIRIGQAFLGGDGSLSAVGRLKKFGAATATGAGALSASATVTTGPVIRTGAAALSGRGSLFIASPTTVLADADNLYLGATPVSVVYVGAAEAWRP